MSDKGTWRKLRKQLEQAGCTIVQGGRSNAHYKVYQGKRLINSIPSTASDHRTMRNVLAQLRREGIPV
jgi:hypothetical protein